MGGFAIDYERDSEEVVALKQHIANQSNMNAGLEDQIMKFRQKQQEAQITMNETLNKLRREADSALELGRELEKRNEELVRERVLRENLELSYATSGERLQSDAKALKELQATLEAVSGRETSAKRALEDAAREKAAQDLRIRDLEANLQQLAHATAPKRRGRASSLSAIHLVSLERELAETRAAVTRSEEAAAKAEKRASQACADAVRTENDAMAMERRLRKEVEDARLRADEQMEELEFLRQQQGAGAAREEELLQRIEMEEAKVTSMEKLLENSRDMTRLEEELARTQKRLKTEVARVRDAESRQAGLVLERDEGTRLLEEARERAERIASNLRSTEADIVSFEARERDLNAQLQRVSSENATLKASGAGSSEKDAYVEKLLHSVTRIRGERDNLRRDLEFLQAESRFTIDDLHKKVRDLSTQLLDLAPLRARLVELEGKADIYTPALADRAGLLRLGRLSVASLVTVAHLDSLRENGLSALHRTEEELRNHLFARDELESSTTTLHNQELASLHQSMQELHEHLDVCNSELSNSNVRCEELEAEAKQLQAQVQDLQLLNRSARSEHSSMHNDLEEKSRELSELTRALENVESERDTLSSRVMTLQHELESLQDDAKRGEERYASLQAQQLSSLSGNEVVQRLREQLQEYKERVERRNEQIGKHQHDVQRLEATQRLQEDRLTELNDELDIVTNEKESMIEDCAEARTARDDALQRVEELEEKLEASERALQNLESQHMLESSSLVSAWASFATKSRVSALKFSAALHVVRNQHISTALQLQVAEEQRSLTASVSDDRASQLQAAVNDARFARKEVEQATVALALLQSHLRRAEQDLTTERDARAGLDDDLAFVRAELDTRVAEVDALRSRLEGLHGEHALLILTSEAHAAEAEALNLKVASLEETIHDLRQRENSSLDRLTCLEGELRDKKDLETSHRETIRALEQEMEDVRRKLSTELEEALARLETVTSNLEGAQRERADEAERRQAEHVALELRLQELLTQLDETSQSTDDLETLRATHAEEVTRLQQELQLASNDLQDARGTLGKLRVSHDQRLTELSSAKDELERRVSELQASLQASKDALLQADTLHGEELSITTERVKSLQVELNALQTHLDDERQRHHASQESQQRSARRFEEAQAKLAELQDDMEAVQSSLKETQASLESANARNSALKDRNTTLEADVQRLDAAHRRVEACVRSSQLELEQALAKLDQSETLISALQAQVDLDGTTHRRTLDELHRQIAQLKSRSSGGGAIRDLQEQLREMDVLMSEKNAQIESNDDFAMSLRKENKKLLKQAAKLTHKMEALQRKLAAAEDVAANSPAAASSAVAVPARVSIPSSATATAPTKHFSAPEPAPAHMALAASSLQQDLSTRPSRAPERIGPHMPAASSSNAPSTSTMSTNTPLTPNSRSHVDSGLGSSAFTRVKTPERRFPPVFRRARTPELSKRSPLEDTHPTSSTLGKRRADDIDDNLPAQGFTSEGTLDPRERAAYGESTPRARKSVRTGFTPVRNTTSRPLTVVEQHSPERSRAAPTHIFDVTNSPRGSAAHVRSTTDPAAAASKPGRWVNKLKTSTNSAPAARTVSHMRSLFEKGS